MPGLVTRLFLSVEYVRSVRHLRQWYIRLILKLILLLFRQEILHQSNLHPTPRRIPLCGITKWNRRNYLLNRRSRNQREVNIICLFCVLTDCLYNSLCNFIWNTKRGGGSMVWFDRGGLISDLWTRLLSWITGLGNTQMFWQIHEQAQLWLPECLIHTCLAFIMTSGREICMGKPVLFRQDGWPSDSCPDLVQD